VRAMKKLRKGGNLRDIRLYNSYSYDLATACCIFVKCQIIFYYLVPMYFYKCYLNRYEHQDSSRFIKILKDSLSLNG